MSTPDLTLHTPTTQLQAFKPDYPHPAHIYVRESNIGIDLTETEAHLLARTIAPEIVLQTGKEHPEVYEAEVKAVLKELNAAIADAVIANTPIPVSLAAKLTSIKLSLRAIARGEVSA